MPVVRIPRRRSAPMFEPLESRRLMSAAPAIPAGAIIHDGGGTQTLNSSMIQSGTSASAPNVYENYVVHSGPTNGAPAPLGLVNVSNVIITQCDVGGWSASSFGIFVNDISNVSITDCNFHDIPTCTGIGAFPTSIANCNFDNNTFNDVQEPIHLDFGGSGNSANNTVSNNYITNYTRWGIELQGISAGGLEVLNNYFVLKPGVTNGGGAISAATGDITTSATYFTSGSEIAYNTIIGAAGNFNCGAIEDYGSGSNVHDNYIQGPWEWGINYCWTGLDGNVPWHVTNNTFIGCGTMASPEPFGTAAQNIAPALSGNQQYAQNAANAPAPPVWSANTSTTTASIAQPVTPTLTAVAESDGVHLTLPAVGGTLTWTAASDAGGPMTDPASNEIHTTVIPAGTTSFVDVSVPNNWKVYYTFSGAAGQSVVVITMPAQVFSSVSSIPPVIAPVSTPVVAPVASTRVVTPIASAPMTPNTPTPSGYIPIAWHQGPSQAIPNYDGPLP